MGMNGADNAPEYWPPPKKTCTATPISLFAK